MNTWTNQDITTVVNRMKSSSYLMYNGLIFISGTLTTEDPAMNQLTELAQMAGGACAVQLHYDTIESESKTDIDKLARFVLANSFDRRTPMAVVVLEEILFAASQDGLEFLLAHEIGHIVNGDTDQSQCEYVELLRRELEADIFAMNLLKSSVGALAFMTIVLSRLKEFIVENKDQDLVESLKLGMDMCNERFSQMHSFTI